MNSKNMVKNFFVVCEKEKFTCHKVKKCVEREKICDFENDCADRSDELFCPNEEIPELTTSRLEIRNFIRSIFKILSSMESETYLFQKSKYKFACHL